MIVFYLDGEQVSSTKAKQVFIHYGLKHGHEMPELNNIWQGKAKSEELRELINNITESILEVFIEE